MVKDFFGNESYLFIFSLKESVAKDQDFSLEINIWLLIAYNIFLCINRSVEIINNAGHGHSNMFQRQNQKTNVFLHPALLFFSFKQSIKLKSEQHKAAKAVLTC